MSDLRRTKAHQAPINEIQRGVLRLLAAAPAMTSDQDLDDIAEAGLLHMAIDPIVRNMLAAITADLAIIDENTGDFNHRYLVILRRCGTAGYLKEAA